MAAPDEVRSEIGHIHATLGRLEGIVESHVEICIRDRANDQERLKRMDDNISSMRRTIDAAGGSWRTVLGVGAFAAAVGAGAGKIGAVFAALVR